MREFPVIAICAHIEELRWDCGIEDKISMEKPGDSSFNREITKRRHITHSTFFIVLYLRGTL